MVWSTPLQHTPMLSNRRRLADERSGDASRARLRLTAVHLSVYYTPS